MRKSFQTYFPYLLSLYIVSLNLLMIAPVRAPPAALHLPKHALRRGPGATSATYTGA
jgi:hypothetical protein